MAFCGVTFTEEKRDFEISPTVVPAKGFDPETDAKVLNSAMKGFGTNEGKIIGVVGYRSTQQLQEIKEKYQTMFGESLIKRLEGELKGNFEKAIVGRFYTRFDYLAYVCRNAMKGAGTDEQALIDVICPTTPEEMTAIKKSYESLYKRDLIKDVDSETSGALGKILVSCATANRDTKEVDNDLAKEEAKKLFEAGEGKWGTDEQMFNQIFATRSFSQLRLTWLYYRGIAKGLIFDSIEKEMSGKLKSAYLTIAQYICDPITYYSEVLYTSMKGMGTDDDRLIRTILSRCEIDLKTIKERYNKLHDSDANLAKKIKKETRGDYEKILLALVSDCD